MNTALPKSYHKNLALPNADISSSQQQIRKLLIRKHCNVCVVSTLLYGIFVQNKKYPCR